MVTKTLAMSGGLYTYQVALGHSFVLKALLIIQEPPASRRLRKSNHVMWCGQMARCAVASACWPVALGNRDNPIAELYEWGKQHDGHIDVLASGRYPINAAVETGIPASRDFHSNADRS